MGRYKTGRYLGRGVFEVFLEAVSLLILGVKCEYAHGVRLKCEGKPRVKCRGSKPFDFSFSFRKTV
jgi:hypothetical protein